MSLGQVKSSQPGSLSTQSGQESGIILQLLFPPDTSHLIHQEFPEALVSKYPLNPSVYFSPFKS